VTIGILRLSLFIAEGNSLKDRRMVLHSLKARLHNSFNIAVAEVDEEDKWRKATLAVVGVGKNATGVNSTLSEVVNFIEGFHGAELLDYEMEMI
jgi:hypothetical protein